MELLKEIDEPLDIEYTIRRASRSVVIDDNNQIALLNATNKGFYLLPGGGIEKNEDIKQCLYREIKEEIGAYVEIINEIGAIIEYNKDKKQVQLSYCYLTKIKGKLEQSSFTAKEVKNGFQLEWMTINKALETIKNAITKTNEYRYKLYMQRETTILLKAKELLQNN